MDKFYKSFEDKFRGDKSEIKKRLLAYEPFLQILKQNDEKPAAGDACDHGADRRHIGGFVQHEPLQRVVHGELP